MAGAFAASAPILGTAVVLAVIGVLLITYLMARKVIERRRERDDNIASRKERIIRKKTDIYGDPK